VARLAFAREYLVRRRSALPPASARHASLLSGHRGHSVCPSHRQAHLARDFG
jgi:hypothetical protein